MTTTTHQAVQPEFRWLVILVSIGFFMQALDTTIVNTAIPAMAIQLNENPLQMHSVIVAYVLSVAACIPLSGWLADRFGIRNIYLSSMVIFSLASLGRLALLKLIPRSQFLSAMSLMSLAGLIGPLMGPTLGGWLVEVATWHWIFLINLPMGILGMIMTFKIMPNQKEPTVKTFDFSGFILLMVAMVGLSLGIENMASSQYSNLVSISLLLIGIIATVSYAYHAHTHQNALFHGRLFRYKIFSIGVLGNFFARLGSNAIPFILPLMLQVAFGFEPFITGLMMIPLVLGSLFSKPIIRPLIQRVGYRRFLLTNTILVGLCIASFSFMTAVTPLWLKVLHLFIFGTLNSLQFVGMNTLTLKDLPQHDASSGNSFLSMIMMLSMSIGVAMAGTLINLFSQHFSTTSISSAFHATLITLGCINIITAIIFWQIPKETTDESP